MSHAPPWMPPAPRTRPTRIVARRLPIGAVGKPLRAGVRCRGVRRPDSRPRGPGAGRGLGRRDLQPARLAAPRLRELVVADRRRAPAAARPRAGAGRGGRGLRRARAAHVRRGRSGEGDARSRRTRRRPVLAARPRRRWPAASAARWRSRRTTRRCSPPRTSPASSGTWLTSRRRSRSPAGSTTTRSRPTTRRSRSSRR